MTPQDQTYLTQAALDGDVRRMIQCAQILDGVTELLADERVDGLRRDALLETLRLVAEVLDERAAWLKEEGLCNVQ